MTRLHPATLHLLPPAVTRPAYMRGALKAGIVHLGLGAFARAHLAAVNEAALHAAPDLRWGIVGVSLRQADTRDALVPQDGLYTLALRDADAQGLPREQLRVIGCLLGVLVAPEDPGAVLQHIAHADTRIVSLTVTEKGYCHDPATLALREDDADIRHDLQHPQAPRSAIGMLVHGLQLRRRQGLGPLTLMSLDNLPANGRTLRGLVLRFAELLDPALRDWIATGCSFPNSMVDRIVPRTTDGDRAALAAQLGLADAWPVVGEPFLDWVVEDDFAAGRPDWRAGGACFVAQAEPFEQRKLRMVNGSHSALAYLGAMAGLDTVDRAVQEPWMANYLHRLLREEVAPTLAHLPEMDLDAYRERVLARYANPALRHQTAQIAMDGSQKLPQRLLGTLRERLAAQAGTTLLSLAVAAWLHYLRGVSDAGQVFRIQDPMAATLQDALRAARQGGGYDVIAFCAAVPMMGNLGFDATFVRQVGAYWRALDQQGVRATLEALN